MVLPVKWGKTGSSNPETQPISWIVPFVNLYLLEQNLTVRFPCPLLLESCLLTLLWHSGEGCPFLVPGYFLLECFLSWILLSATLKTLNIATIPNYFLIL